MKFRAVSNSFATLATQFLGSNPRQSVFNPRLSPFWTDSPSLTPIKDSVLDPLFSICFHPPTSTACACSQWLRSVASVPLLPLFDCHDLNPHELTPQLCVTSFTNPCWGITLYWALLKFCSVLFCTVKVFFCNQDFFFFNCEVKDCNRTIFPPFYGSAIFLVLWGLNNVSSHRPPNMPSQQQYIQNYLLAPSSEQLQRQSHVL